MAVLSAPLLRHWVRLLALAAAALASTGLAAEPLEYAVKAAYLSKFGFYVEWPSGAFANATASVNLCVIGEDPFGTLLDDAVAGQQIEGRTIVVRRLKSASREAGCHIAYFGEAHPASAFEPLHGNPVLIVTDSRSAGTPGIVNFVLKDNRVRFNVDDEVAAQNGLKISSKLLGLALNVKARGSR